MTDSASQLPLINPRMGTRFLAGSAFPRPPRLTLDVVIRSTSKPPRTMLGGGAEKGGRGRGWRRCDHLGPNPHTRVKPQSFFSDLRGFRHATVRQSRVRGLQRVPTVGPDLATYVSSINPTRARFSRPFLADTRTRNGGARRAESAFLGLLSFAVSSAGAARRGSKRRGSTPKSLGAKMSSQGHGSDCGSNFAIRVQEAFAQRWRRQRAQTDAQPRHELVRHPCSCQCFSLLTIRVQRCQYAELSDVLRPKYAHTRGRHW